jgi:hypothetical protein
MTVRTCDDVEHDTVRVLDVEVAGRVRPNRHERTSSGLEPSEGGGPIGDVERWDDGIMRWNGVAQELEPEGTAGEFDAVRCAIHHRAAKGARVERLGRTRICHVKRKLVVAGERHCRRPTALRRNSSTPLRCV